MDSKEDQLVQQFLQNRNLADSTCLRYLYAFKVYGEFINKTPTEWIEEAEDEEEERVRMRRRKIKSYLLDFKAYLESKEYSTWTVKSMMVPVRVFYNEFDIELPKIIIKDNGREETIEDVPSKEEIRVALKYSSIKYKAIILLLSSSGMGASELLSLKYADFLNSLKEYIKLPKNRYVGIDDLVELIDKRKEEDPLIIPVWQITRIKTNKPFITFSTPESLDALLDYLKSEPPRYYKTPLFRGSNSQTEALGDKGLFQYLKRLNEKCGFGKPDRQIKFRSHAVGRKYFTNVLYHNGLPQLTIDWFLAHSIDKTTSAYFKTNINKLKEQYITCIEDLSIMDIEVKTIESQEFIEVKKQLSELKMENKEKNELFEKLQREIDAIRYIKNE